MTRRDIPRFYRALKGTNFYFLSNNVAEKSIYSVSRANCSEWLSRQGIFNTIHAKHEPYDPYISIGDILDSTSPAITKAKVYLIFMESCLSEVRILFHLVKHSSLA